MTTSLDQISPNDIAIVGMALRVPGASNVPEFWSNLRNGVESIRTLSLEELAAAGETADRTQHPNYVARTADLPEMEMFDADFFGFSPKEAAIMDPQHRHFLECAWEAMEDAGRTPDTNSGPVGVFAGCGMGSYFYFNVCSNRQLVDQVGMFLLRHTGNDKDFLATRASYSFDLKGPSVNVQTACSTSLVAVHYACQSLLSGECDMALAGGVTIELPHRRGYIFNDGEILSPDGHCRAFDHRAAGTVFGSGVGVVVLRRLADAVADNDIIHAVIKSSAINNDGGEKAGYLAPSISGQAAAVVEAQQLAGIDAESIQYVECHGTGTYLGDPIEIEALTSAFRQSTSRTGFCRVGSVKTNIGHLDTAAGVVGLIKGALALKHGEIPPTLNFEKPNPAIDFERSPFVVNSTLTPWPSKSGPRRAAINSLGVGGTNAHVILEEAPAIPSATSQGVTPDTAHLVVLAAKQRKALDDAALRLATALMSDPAMNLDDVTYTLLKGRKHFDHRRVFAVRGREDAIRALGDSELKRGQAQTVIEQPTGAVFLFPGGGAQHVGMASSLYENEPLFRSDVDEGLNYLPPEIGREIRNVWFNQGPSGEDAAHAFLRPSIQLPAILIVEVAIARLWMRWGLRPTHLIGHSMGENAAACVAGVMSFRDVVNLVRLRGELFDTIEPGGMLSVSIDPAALEKIILPELDIASVNAPELCVVSGSNENLERFRKLLDAKEIGNSRIPIDIAAHSRMLDGILPRFEAFLRSITLRAPTIPIISNRTGEPLTQAEAADPMYWVAHLRNTVLFGKGMAKLSEDRSRVYIEVGPGKALSSLAKAQGTIDGNQVINTLPHPDDDADDQLHALAAVGRAWAAGLPVDIDKLWSGRAPRRVSLPTYAFQHERYFIEQQAVSPANNATAPLLKKPDMSDWGYRLKWKKSLPDIVDGAENEIRSWLLFVDDGAVGKLLTERLRGLGHHVVTVSSGDAFARRGTDEYVLCPEDGRPGYDALMSGLASDGGVPARIVHLWLLTQKETFRPGSNFFHRNQEHGLYCLLHLAQAMSEAAVTDELHLTVATNGMQRVADEALPYPEKATVLGPARVLPKEMPGATVTVIDLDLPVVSAAPRRRISELVRSKNGEVQADGGAARAVSALWEEIFSTPASETIAYRDDRRWSQVLDKLSLRDAANDAGIRENGVYLFTGAHGDIALTLAEQLAERFSARIILLGRSPLPPQEQWRSFCRTQPADSRMRRAIQSITAMQARGAEVLCLTADVSNPDEMRSAIVAARARFGRIDGVFHTAGVVADDLIQLKTVESMEAVLTPKVLGTVVLDSVLAEEELDFLVLFSSTSTETAPAGQVDYVAANAFLNAYADSQRGCTNRKTIALHWGVWNEIGIAARATGATAVRTAADPGSSETSGPLFERWVEDGAGVSWLEMRLSPESNWMLNEHRLVSGTPVLPGTGYLELILQAAAEHGMVLPGTIEDLMFLRPLVVPDGEEKLLRVRFEAATEGYKVVVAAGAGDLFQTFAQAMFRIGHADTVRPLHRVDAAAKRASIHRAAPAGEKLRAAQEEHIGFGPRWQVLRRISVGDGEAVAELELSQEYAGDIESGTILHPAIVDIATGFAMELVPGYGTSKVLWAPVSYGVVLVHRQLPARARSWVRLADSSDFGDGYAAFDVVVEDLDGRPVLEAQRFVIKRLDDDASFDAVSEPARAEEGHLSSPVQELATMVRQGILPAEGMEALLRALATGETQPIVSSLDLAALQKRSAAKSSKENATQDMFARPKLDSEYVAPRNEVETTLAGFWRELLGVDQIGVHDSFFDIGGHSLIAVRLFRMVKNEFGVDFPISVLFEAPTIALCAEMIEARAPRKKAFTTGNVQPLRESQTVPTHLVTMHPGKNATATPFFLCAGMFGNVLNLRHLALHIGADRPVYALQARGLYGDQEPHATFEEMARDYLAEIRAVQPHGPYLLGGFSGGGLTAYEMAHQLVAEGEEVAHLILLDTPQPTQPKLSKIDLAQMKLQDIRREGLSFMGNWVRNRMQWEEENRRRREAANEAISSDHFHNLRIEAAFRNALPLYQVKPYDGTVSLFRPRPEVLYRLSGGRLLQPGRNIILEDNGWSPFVQNLDIQEVPGDHDSMVLEPFVRVLADHVRRRLRAAIDRTVMPMRSAAE